MNIFTEMKEKRPETAEKRRKKETALNGVKGSLTGPVGADGKAVLF